VGAVLDWRLLGRVEQCADIGVRLIAEYANGNGNADGIVFRSLSGQRIVWKKWLEGRYSVNENASSIIYRAGAARTETPREFDEYLTFVMSYVNTASLMRDWREVGLEDIQIGDVLIQPSCPGAGLGHMSIVVDACEDSGGKRRYLFIDGYTPARLPVVRQRQPNTPVSAWMTPEEYLEYMDQFGPGDFYRSPDWVATAGP
jgi:hypothetical protein